MKKLRIPGKRDLEWNDFGMDWRMPNCYSSNYMNKINISQANIYLFVSVLQPNCPQIVQYWWYHIHIVCTWIHSFKNWWLCICMAPVCYTTRTTGHVVWLSKVFNIYSIMVGFHRVDLLLRSAHTQGFNIHLDSVV